MVVELCPLPVGGVGVEFVDFRVHPLVSDGLKGRISVKLSNPIVLMDLLKYVVDIGKSSPNPIFCENR